MTPEQLSANLGKVNQMINAEYPAFADNLQVGVGLGMTSLAFIRKRIQGSGKGADDAPFKPYSSKPSLVGASSFRTKGNAQAYFGSKEKRKAMEWRTVKGNHLSILPGGYKALRVLDGQQAAFKDFTRTVEMWDSIHIMGTKGGNGKFTTTIGTTNELSNKKLEGNVKREGKEILDVSAKEKQMLQEMLDKFVTKIVDKAIQGNG
jgi:hypothetical protein